MKENIIGVYRPIYLDLVSLGIGTYLTSRKFEIFKSKNNFHGAWSSLSNTAHVKWMIINLSEKDHALYCLILLFNSRELHLAKNDIVIRIIIDFISGLKNRDLNNLIESIEVTPMDDSDRKILKLAFETKMALKADEDLVNPEIEIMPKPNLVNAELKKNNLSVIEKEDKVFIVHGHDEAIKEKVARVIENQGLKAIILHEQNNGGSTIIEKLEKNSNVDFVVVLLTADDHGNVKTQGKLNARARQNVVFELGYFIGKLGRSKVMPLLESGVEKPGDIDGVVYTSIDSGGAWKYTLCDELKAAGFTVDKNKIK